MNYQLVALAVVFVAILWAMHRRNRIKVRAQRSAMYADVLGLFEAPVITQDDVNFPVLEAVYHSRQIRIEPIVDHVAVRKIPSLWLLVTVKGAVPYPGAMDFLVRPQNTEFYSPSSRLHENIAVPPGWPEHAILRSDNAAGMPPVDRLTPHIKMFEDPKMKEFLVTQRGVRLVYQLDQATRPNYMVLREMVFGNFTLNQGLTTRLLDTAIEVIEDLNMPEAATRKERIA